MSMWTTRSSYGWLKIARSLCLMTFHCTLLTIVVFSCSILGAADLAHKGNCFGEWLDFWVWTEHLSYNCGVFAEQACLIFSIGSEQGKYYIRTCMTEVWLNKKATLCNQHNYFIFQYIVYIVYISISIVLRHSSELKIAKLSWPCQILFKNCFWRHLFTRGHRSHWQSSCFVWGIRVNTSVIGVIAFKELCNTFVNVRLNILF